MEARHLLAVEAPYVENWAHGHMGTQKPAILINMNKHNYSNEQGILAKEISGTILPPGPSVSVIIIL